MRSVILLTNILAPYRIPLFNILGDMLKKENIEFKVMFMAESESNRQWRIYKDDLKVDFKVLPGIHYFIRGYDFPIHLNPTIWHELRKEAPDIIISGGYSYLSNWIALFYSKIYRKRLILWTSTTPECIRGRDILRSNLRKLFIKECNAFITYGKRAAIYLSQLGVDPKSIFIGCNVGDVAFFKNLVSEYRRYELKKLNNSSDDSLTLLFVGQLIPRKGILHLLHALAELKSTKWRLLIVGDGPLKKKIISLAHKFGIDNQIKLLGFKQKEELVKLYAVADIFVLPSLIEPYAIVVSEALASGLFVVCSKYDGAAYDLIQPGYNGLIIDPFDVQMLKSALAEAINIVSSPQFSREQISFSIKDFTPERYARAFLEAIKYVINKN